MGPVSIAATVLIAVLLILRIVFPGAVTALATPFWKLGSALTSVVGSGTSVFGDKAKLMQENEALKREQAALIAQLATVTARARDVERLVGVRTEPAHGILAGVIARPPLSPYDVLIVDAGSDAGVTNGALVLGPAGTPLGTVIRASKDSSRIALFSESGRETAGWIGEAKLPIGLVGTGSGTFLAVVARDAGVVVGDAVYLPGPGAQSVGTVVEVTNDPSLPRSSIRIRPTINPFSVTWVEIRATSLP